MNHIPRSGDPRMLWELAFESNGMPGNFGMMLDEFKVSVKDILDIPGGFSYLVQELNWEDMKCLIEWAEALLKEDPSLFGLS